MLGKFEAPSTGLRMIFESCYRIFGRSLASLPDLQNLAFAISSVTTDLNYYPEFYSLYDEFAGKEQVGMKPSSMDFGAHKFQDVDNVGTYSKEEIETMLSMISEFDSYSGKYDEMIDAMFPNFNDLDDALNFAIKNCHLYHKVIQNISEEARNLPVQFFSEPINREITLKAVNSAPPFLAFSNALLRLFADGKLNKDMKSLALAHKMLENTETVGAEPLDLPIRPDTAFKAIAPSLTVRQRAFLLVRLAQFKCTTSSNQDDFPMSWKIAHSFSYMFSYQMMLALQPFVNHDLLDDEFRGYRRLRAEFTKEVLLNEVKPTASNQVFKKLITSTLDTKVKGAMGKPKFHIFSMLEPQKVAALLALTTQPLDGSTSTFIEFESAEENVPAPKAKSRKRRKGKKAAKKALEDVVQEEIPGIFEDSKAEKEESAGESSSTIELPAETANKEIEPVSPQDKQSVDVADVAVENKVNAQSESEKNEAVEEILVSAEEIQTQKEIEDLLQEHRKTLEHYKKLKELKVDHSKLLNTRFQVVSKPSTSQPRNCLVASFTTEDWRMVHCEANRVYIKNQVEWSANCVNQRSTTMKFQWVFDHNITIDLEAYRFLCQLFRLSSGKNLLTFDNFLAVFAMLNPSKKYQIDNAFFSKGSKKKVRFVFQSEHAIQANGVTYVPPIGGAHCEHLSSRFNHKRIRNFLQYCAAHPYFFLKIHD